MTAVLSHRDLVRRLDSADTAEAASPAAGAEPPWLTVDLASWDTAAPAPRFAAPCPVIGVAAAEADRTALPGAALVDVIAHGTDELATLEAAIAANPTAAAVLVRLLRFTADASVADGLFAESLAYSTLQHGAAFERWLADNPPGEPGAPETAAPVLVEREENTLGVTLNRPRRHNAYSAELRDALCEALQLALADPTIDAVVVRGAGPSFSAGGDLREFGLARDAATAHLARTARSAAALVHALGHRIRFEVHGACIGAGIELPAFAPRVTARADAFFQLPEVSMGLIPGAGGTVSICKRIGRWRTAFMALSNRRVDAATAHAWGLVDAVV